MEGNPNPKRVQEQILDGVLLSDSANRSFHRDDPRDYLTALLDEAPRPSKKELPNWVNSHLVPYDPNTDNGSVKERYRRLLAERPGLVEAEFKKLTMLAT